VRIPKPGTRPAKVLVTGFTKRVTTCRTGDSRVDPSIEHSLIPVVADRT